MLANLDSEGLSPGVHGGTLRTLIGRARDIRLMSVYGYARLMGYTPDLELAPDILLAVDVEDDRVWARGASDDKGNMLIPILAAEAMLKTRGSLPVNVKFFFEGQEEIGSPQLPEFISRHADMLACDLVLSADGGQWEDDQLPDRTRLVERIQHVFQFRDPHAVQGDLEASTPDGGLEVVHKGLQDRRCASPLS